jgi:hypothetical protein
MCLLKISTALHVKQSPSTNTIEEDARKAAMAEETLEESGDTEQEPEEDSEEDTEEDPEAGAGTANIQKRTNDQIKAAREARAAYVAAGTQQSPNQTARNTKPNKKFHTAKVEPKKVTTTTPCKYCGNHTSTHIAFGSINRSCARRDRSRLYLELLHETLLRQRQRCDRTDQRRAPQLTSRLSSRNTACEWKHPHLHAVLLYYSLTGG